MMDHDDTYPTYSRSELVADGAVHLLGLCAALIAIAMVLWSMGGMLNFSKIASLSVYWLGLIMMLVMSFAYNLTPWERFRAKLRRADHATIFLKIAGTYTPIVISLGTAVGYVILGAVWALAMVGIISKLFLWRRPGMGSTFMYLGMGWMSVALVYGLFSISPAAGWCAVIGGLTYSAGTIFFHWESLRFANAIWHGFVVTASGFFFAAVTLAVAA